jgi:hypothetical protein
VRQHGSPDLLLLLLVLWTPQSAAAAAPAARLLMHVQRCMSGVAPTAQVIAHALLQLEFYNIC